jgi:hypothetical protein
MSSIPISNWKLTLATYAFVLVGALLVYGYQFPSENNYVEVPGVLSLLDPELYKNDFYVQEMIKFNPRFYYHNLIYFTAKLGLSLSHTYFLYYFLAFSSFVIGLYALGQLFGRSRLSATVLVFLGLVAGNGTIGYVDLFRTEPIPAIFAMGFAIWGIYFSFRQKWILGYLLFGVACLLQFLVGILPGTLMAPVLILEAKKKNALRSIVLPFLILGTMASLVYVPMVITGHTGVGTLDSAEFVYIYGNVRHPHHIIFSTFGWEKWINIILFMLGGFLCILTAESLSSEEKVKLSLVIGASAFALLLGYVLVEVYPIAFIAKLQLARTTPFAQLIVLIGISTLVNEYNKQRSIGFSVLLITLPLIENGGILLFLLALSLWTLRATNNFHLVQSIYINAIAAAGAFFLLVVKPANNAATDGANSLKEELVLFSIVFVPFLLERYFNAVRKNNAIIIPIYTLALSTCLFFVLGLFNALPGELSNLFQERVAIYRIPTDEITKLALRFRERSEKDALVLVPPSDNKFRLYSERAVPYTFKGFPYTDGGIQEWVNRMEVIFGSESPPSGFRNLDLPFKERSGSELVNVAKRLGANYILTRVDWHGNIKCLVVDKENNWIIYKIGGENN